MAIGDGQVFKTIFTELMLRGKFVKPRGQLVLEAENFTYELPPYVRFQSFKRRKFNLNYVKDELLWYLKGDRFDLSITEKAKIWKSIVNKDGSINSNYGQYIFSNRASDFKYFGGGQFDQVVSTLSLDKDSRRASMMILNRDHLLSETNDVPCTYALNFRIRENMLNMSVHMRSQDAIFGMGNDAPAFSFIHEMMLQSLRRVYPDLAYGNYFHIADSFHVYERHFDMIQTITGVSLEENHYDGVVDDEYEDVRCPEMLDHEEVSFLRMVGRGLYDPSSIPERFAFTRWLFERS